MWKNTEAALVLALGWASSSLLLLLLQLLLLLLLSGVFEALQLLRSLSRHTARGAGTNCTEHTSGTCNGSDEQI